jgi:hypothetical protein
MNLFKRIVKWTGVLVYAAFLATVAYAATLPDPIKVYLITSSRGGEYTIEKIYLKKENAEKYRDMFKDSHNYSVEERELTE